MMCSCGTLCTQCRSAAAAQRSKLRSTSLDSWDAGTSWRGQQESLKEKASAWKEVWDGHDFI